ncbi:RebB family R body protein [Chryseobacterium sp. IHB B 17019]|uniref:RebB family R body protein n=1 Tax=Chryseobacterium sp. IHB B 17019 TaxID=1721091 RepID=UPI0009E848EE|nr:RebB family R body protein [Chryseobacterium sp. IHB B 17019]
MSKEEKKPTESAVPEDINEPTTEGINNLMDVPEHPTFGHGGIYRDAIHSTGILYQNAISDQNQQNILGQAATVQGVIQIYSLDTTANTTPTHHPENSVEPTHGEYNHHDKDKK